MSAANSRLASGDSLLAPARVEEESQLATPLGESLSPAHSAEEGSQAGEAGPGERKRGTKRTGRTSGAEDSGSDMELSEEDPEPRVRLGT